MIASNLPKQLWAEVVATAIYLLNISPTNAVMNRTPYEAWKGRKPKVSHLKIFGCIAYVLDTSLSRRKLDKKSEKCILIGYIPKSKAYRLYNPLSGKVLVSRDLEFNEDKFWTWTQDTTKVIQAHFPDFDVFPPEPKTSESANSSDARSNQQSGSNNSSPLHSTPQTSPGNLTSSSSPAGSSSIHPQER